MFVRRPKKDEWNRYANFECLTLTNTAVPNMCQFFEAPTLLHPDPTTPHKTKDPTPHSNSDPEISRGNLNLDLENLWGINLFQRELTKQEETKAAKISTSPLEKLQSILSTGSSVSHLHHLLGQQELFHKQGKQLLPVLLLNRACRVRKRISLRCS